MKKSIFFLLFLGSSVLAYPPLPKTQDEDEMLFAKRALHFWHVKDYKMAKHLIENHLHEHEGCVFGEYFAAILGDISFEQKKYDEAIEHYAKLNSTPFLSEVRERRLEALFVLERFQSLYDGWKESVKSLTPKEKFYLAESCFHLGNAILSDRAAQDALFDEAREIYKQLSQQETYRIPICQRVASMLLLQGKKVEAAGELLKLGLREKDPELLKQAAELSFGMDEKISSEISEGLLAIGTPTAGAYWMKGCIQAKKFKEIKKNREWLLSIADGSTLGFTYFNLGLAAFEEGYHLQVILDLTKALSQNLAPPYDREALLTILASAKEMGRVEAAEKALSLIRERYPNDIPQALLLKAYSQLRGKEKRKALETFEEFLCHFPHNPLAETALFEKICLLAMGDEWKTARKQILAFFEKYPLSSHKPKLAALAADLSLMQVGWEKGYTELAEDLERGLAWRAFDDTKEKKQLLATSWLKMGKHEEALKLLLEMDEPQPLLLTQCYLQKKNEPEKIIFYGEKALLQNPDQPLLHVQLFDAYLDLFSKMQENRLIDKAAAHLDAIIDRTPVSMEKRLWLAHYFAKVDARRAIPILESLIECDTDALSFYEEALMLARLYRKENEKEKACLLIKNMLAARSASEPKLELFLADLFAETGMAKEAKELYTKLESSKDPETAKKSSLQIARLCFQEEPERALAKLRDLSMKKELAYEPIHLEACFEYAEMSASLSRDNKEEALLKNLLHIKEAYTTQDTYVAKAYHQDREKLPEKDRIYQAYMRYLNARIYLLESKFAVDPVEKKNKLGAAHALLATLREGKYAVSEYLSDKAREKLLE